MKKFGGGRETSQEFQNRGISDPTKRLMSSKNLKKKFKLRGVPEVNKFEQVSSDGH